MEIIITALIFFFLGRYSLKEGADREIIEKLARKVTKKAKKTTPGAIEIPTPEKQRFYGSEEEKIDKDWQEKAKDLL